MVMPTTAIEIEYASGAFLADLKRQEAILQRWFDAAFDECVWRMFPQRPYTDDMMQMCVDTGTDVPDQWINRDPIIFTWP